MAHTHTLPPRSTMDVETHFACLREPKTIRPFEVVRYCDCFLKPYAAKTGEILPSGRPRTMNIGVWVGKAFIG